MTDWLDQWARAAPDRVFLAERVEGAWRKVTYAEARDLARRIAQAIIDRGLDAERPIAILSGNSVDHALIGLGAMIAGVPYAPVSQPYSLVAKDYGKLKTILDILTPGLVYVSDGARFTLALAAGVPKTVEVVFGVNPPTQWPSTPFEALIAKPAGPEVDAAHAKVGPDTVAKLLFTSGSTGSPKGVINTQKMMTSNQAMLKGVNPSYGMVAPVLVDWLPWSHTFGGNNNFNLVLDDRRLVLYRRGPAAARRDRRRPCATCGRVADHLLQRSEGLRDAAALCPVRRRSAQEPVRPAQGVVSMPARRCSTTCARRFERLGPRNGRPVAPILLSLGLDRDRPVGAQRHREGVRPAALSAFPITAST